MRQTTLIFFLLLCLSSCSHASDYKVISIVDGDTIDVLTKNKEKIRVRLAHIDAPEKHQAYGTVSKKELGDKIFDKEVDLSEISKDTRWGRTIAVVNYQGRNINLEMVESGLAWHYKQFSKDKKYAEAEIKAQDSKKGLWQDEKPIPPWKFRHKPKEKK